MLKKTLGSLALASALFACSPPGPLISMSQPGTEAARPGQMTVTGTATLEVSPDCADLTMTISADGARPGLATKGVKDKQQALIAGLAKIGIEASDIKLSYLNLHPVYYSPPNPGWSTLKVATYRSEVTVTVTTKKFDLIGDIMEAGANSGATTMSSQFRRSDMPELKKKVRDMALDAAKGKAAQTAKSLGIELGRVVSVVEAPAGQMWSTAYFPNNANAMETRPGAPTVAIGGALQPLTLDITIGFELPHEV